MKEDLLPYYEHELSVFRNMGKEFAKSYSKIAQRLMLEPDKCDDPHVERLIEAFAFLAGRVHHKIDDEFPEITEALLGILYPHYLQPIPSMSIAQFKADPEQAQLATGYEIKQHSQLYTKPMAGKDTSCSFRTCYPVTLWPLSVVSAAVAPASNQGMSSGPSDSVAVIRIELKCLGPATFESLPLESLRFYLNGEGPVVHTLYELLFNNVIRVEVGSLSRSRRAPSPAPLPTGCVGPVGFNRHEGLLPYPARSFVGYRLLQEYFSFPQKFLFFDLTGFPQINRKGMGKSVQILIHISSFERRERLQLLEQKVNTETFQLGCTPIVNLFDRLAEPISITQKDTDYAVIPDIRRRSSTEIYSINRVTSTAPYLEKPREYVPFYSIRHAYSEDPTQGYWYASRKTSELTGDHGTEVYLSLVNSKFDPVRPPDESLTVHVTCTNRDLAGELPFTGSYGELSLEAGTMLRVRALMIPTKTIRAPLRRGLQWRLISHLALNYLSIVEGGKEALQEILKLYDFTEDPVTRRQITGITDLSSTPYVSRIISKYGVVFVQGIQVDMELDESEFVGSGIFVFAAVLEAFFGLYSSMNSFTQLKARSKQRKGYIKQWQPRSGEQILL
jgi:type VI secretion system protein ImpG